jgi:hypothetical protein
MEQYKSYLVYTARTRLGKREEAASWWRDKGKPMYESAPGFLSATAFASQWRLGQGRYDLEIWVELKDYASLDRLDEDAMVNPQKYAAYGESLEIFEWGPSRMVGEWPQSQFSPDA